MFGAIRGEWLPNQQDHSTREGPEDYPQTTERPHSRYLWFLIQVWVKQPGGISRLRNFDTAQSRDCAVLLRNLEIAQSRDWHAISGFWQCNLEIAQIPKLRGTDTWVGIMPSICARYLGLGIRYEAGICSIVVSMKRTFN